MADGKIDAHFRLPGFYGKAEYEAGRIICSVAPLAPAPA